MKTMKRPFCVLDSEGRDLNERRTTINDESVGGGNQEYLVDAKSDRKFVPQPIGQFESSHGHYIRVELGERSPVYSEM